MHFSLTFNIFQHPFYLCLHNLFWSISSIDASYQSTLSSLVCFSSPNTPPFKPISSSFFFFSSSSFFSFSPPPSSPSSSSSSPPSSSPSSSPPSSPPSSSSSSSSHHPLLHYNHNLVYAVLIFYFQWVRFEIIHKGASLSCNFSAKV